MDYAAATPVDTAVMKAMQPYFSDVFYNPSATYEPARKARDAINEAKAEIAGTMGVKPAELVLTSGGTEANNLAIQGAMSRYPGKKILTSAVEHESVLEPAKQWNFVEIPVNSQGIIDAGKAAAMIDDDVVMVSVMLANNEVGAIQPVKDLAAEMEKIRKKRKARKISTTLILHTDAAQAPLYLDVHPHRLGADLLTVNGGKIYGPKQSAALYVRAGIRLEPLMRGGGQQRGLRSGTESPASAAGLAEALKLAQKKRNPESKRLSELRYYFFSQLKKRFPNAKINGPRKRRLPNNVHVTLPGNDNERLINLLDERGIMAAAGSACSAANAEPSHVLRSMGISDADAQASLRFTMGRGTTKEKIDRTVEVLAEIAD